MNSPPTAAPLKPWQRHIVVIGWLTYASFYLGRVNIATAIPDMQSSLGLSKSQLGLISTAFLLTYAASTLLNGWLGDRLKLRRFVALGLIGTGALNILFGTLSFWPILLIVWTINGYFQGTGWGPILRLLANWLSPAQRRKISGTFGSSFVAGNAITWLLTGWLVASFGWRMAFLVPGFLLIAAGIIWFTIVRDTPTEAGFIPIIAPAQPNVKEKQITAPAFWTDFLASLGRFWSLAITAIFIGFIFAALTVWIPTYYVEVGGLGIGTASTLSALLPFAGIGGTVLAGWLVGNYLIGKEIASLTVILLFLAGTFGLYPLLPFNIIVSSSALMLVSGIAFAATSLILTTMTLAFGQREETSSVAGLLDFSFSVGGGFSGVIIGTILDNQPWTVVFLALAAAALVAASFLFITRARLRA